MDPCAQRYLVQQDRWSSGRERQPPTLKPVFTVDPHTTKKRSSKRRKDEKETLLAFMPSKFFRGRYNLKVFRQVFSLHRDKQLIALCNGAYNRQFRVPFARCKSGRWSNVSSATSQRKHRSLIAVQGEGSKLSEICISY